MGGAVKSIFGGGAKKPDTSAIDRAQARQQAALDAEKVKQEARIDARLALRRRGRQLLEFRAPTALKETLGG